MEKSYIHYILNIQCLHLIAYSLSTFLSQSYLHLCEPANICTMTDADD